MSRITVDLVRRRAEHNNCEISTLEELSLHQQDLERIEHLDRWCKGLKILYLQNNLIPRIENVGRLKQLQYLNLALNNVEKIENLQNCEFLEKLDLTLNFIGDLLSVESLSCNVHLRELFLTGNPCTDYGGYRDFVVAVLPQIVSLDGKEVTRSERIMATQRLADIRREVIPQQEEHKLKRVREKADHEKRINKDKEKSEKKPGFDGRWYTDPNAHVVKEGDTAEPEGDDEKAKDKEEEEFWNEEDIPYTPESRTETLIHMAEKRKEKAKEPNSSGPEPAKRVRKLEIDGKMLNVNEGRHEFHLSEAEDDSSYLLDITIPRFMDTSLVDCDIQPTYVRVTIKGKILQLVLQDEVSPDLCSAKRSQTTGHLLLTMPKVKQTIIGRKIKKKHPKNLEKKETVKVVDEPKTRQSTELLEVDPNVKRGADFSNIVKERDESIEDCSPSLPVREPTRLVSELSVEDRGVGENFVDDPDVPPLI